MSFSLHAATVPTMLQIIGAAKGWLDKAEACDMSEADVIDAKLIDDMLPFTYQIKSIALHTAGAFAGVKEGVFSPDFSDPPRTITELRTKLDEAEASLKALTVDEVEAMVGQDMRFEIGDKKLPFTAEEFLLSFSQPNYFFHATTAYDILRAKGVSVGKLDFLGALRLKG